MDNQYVCKGDGECLIQSNIYKNNIQCTFNCIGLNCKHDNLDDNDYFCLNCSIKKWNNDKLKRKYKKDDDIIEIKESPNKKYKIEGYHESNNNNNNIIDINDDTPTSPHSSWFNSNDEKEEEEDELEKKIKQLSPSQKEGLDYILKGGNLFITGSAGSGKSFLIDVIKEKLMLNNIKVRLTALTGASSWNIGGETFHRFMGWKLGDQEDINLLVKMIRKNKTKIDELKTTQVLIIDEISMLLPELFIKFDTVLKIIRGNNKVFGGLQVILVGDFLQIPYIRNKNNKNNNKTIFSHIFKTETWEKGKFKLINLETNFRQTNDNKFKDLLNNIRKGFMTKEDKILLKTRINNNILNERDDIPVLFSKRDDVSVRNKKQLDKLKGKKRIYEANIIDITLKDNQDKKESTFFKNPPIENRLELKIGALVILCCNLDVQNGLYNGTPGKVIAFSEHKTNNIKHLTLSPPTLNSIIENLTYVKNYNDDISEEEEKEYINTHTYRLPIVEFSNGETRLIQPHRWELNDKYNRKKIISVYINIPLILKYSITIHRSQGLTLDNAVVTMNCFENGQIYTALSRVRKLEDLYIALYNESAIKTDLEVLKFYESNNLI